MPKPRKHLVSLDATPYYHCVSRCVRKAFLCGVDSHSGQSYEHRRQWVEDRILLLAKIFAIDVCAYAVMSNHHHCVLHINKDESLQWTHLEVCERWHSLYKGTPLTQKFHKGEVLSNPELEAVVATLEQWRLRLHSLSWFMSALNEPLARQANFEDKCTGRFWEGRFTSQALLDEKALAACMAYVDLNPIRAKMASTPESSEHTSIKKRIAQFKLDGSQPKSLTEFVGNPREPMPQGLPFHLNDYIQLVDWTGRILREDKRGAIDSRLPPILDRLNIPEGEWKVLTTKFESRFKSLVGCVNTLKEVKHLFSFVRSPHLKSCSALLH